MGTHTSREPADFVVGDPDARWTLRLVRWWWLLPPVGLALWPVSPLLAVMSTVALFGIGSSARGLAPSVLAPRHGLVVVPQHERGAWSEARQSIGRIRAAWPALGAMAEPTDIGPALDRARWGLAVLLVRRAGTDRALKDLDEAVRGLPERAPLRAEVADRRAEIRARHDELTGAIAERLGALHRLAEISGEHAHQQHRTEQVRGALRRARRVDDGDPFAPDAVAEVAERTAAVLAAYHELSALPGPDAPPEGLARGGP
ncbi:hypothetical protein ACFO1B_17605 [Dactylosporangium siamense]|uniref:Uncharacterized protein n=1 Tax=Dactylosporangium siamense TaxID=685454 RepID=A0A919PIV6_9ACTN|nr:hypothetical protein [Dactylosporangium siamense]GIG45660.1 hypothetical protein Dsi01nite_037010 [Dactylosporangium siamense]